MPSFGPKSKERLATCAPKLQELFNSVITEVDCTVLCGERGKDEQEQAFKEGKSQVHYPDSRHNTHPSQAADVAPYPTNWNDKKSFDDFAIVVKRHAQNLGIQIRWGGEFKNFYDGPHYELI